MKKPVLNVGDRFGKLVVIKLDHYKPYNTKTKVKSKTYNVINYQQYYLCKCDCGNECIVRKDSLLNKNTQSCSCMQKEAIREINKKYCFIDSRSKTRLYSEYLGIKRRCYNKNEPSYKYYCNRGIKVCEEWKNDFMSFYNWAINNGYKENLSIDRINVNGNYEPSNCRWVDLKTQQYNKTNTLYFNNYTIKDIMQRTGLKYHTIYRRIKQGYDINAVMNTNLHKNQFI